MRFTLRSFLAATLFTAVAAAARAQDAGTPPPPEPVATPVADLPGIPIVQPNVPAVEPVLATDQSAPTVEPIAAPVVIPAAPEKAQVTTTSKRVTQKIHAKPVAKPALEATESGKDAAAAASMAAVAADTSANAPPPPPPPVAEKVAPPAPAARSVTVETQSAETVPAKKLGVGSWILFGIALFAFAGIAVKFLRRQRKSPSAIVDLSASASAAGLKPSPVPRS